MERQHLLDQRREIVGEHSLAIATAPSGFKDLNVVPVDAPAVARHLKSLAALSLNYFYVLGSNGEVHLDIPLGLRLTGTAWQRAHLF